MRHQLGDSYGSNTLKNLTLGFLALVCCVWAFTVYAAKIALNSPPEVPTNLNAREFKEFTAKRNALLTQYGEAQAKIDSQARDCGEVAEGSPKVSECMTKAGEVRVVVKNYREALKQFSVSLAAGAAVDTRDPEVVRIINEMNALAKRLGWSVEEQARLDKALNSFRADGTQNVTRDQIRSAWQDVMARGQDGDLARKAALGDGPGLVGAGTQSFQDCAIFALANASGLPYSVVAARATKLISEGGWRDAAERANPQKAIEQRGLIGGEVAMLAESIGQVEMVPSTAFAKTLKLGRPVMVNVVPQDGDVTGGHQVVLSKAFQHGGEIWYEVVDSNQGPQRRLYVSSKELGTVLQENGVAFRPEPGTTTKPLR
jgi:hypothetical protein